MAAKDDWKQSMRAAFNPEAIFYSETERKNGTLDEVEIDQILPFQGHTFKVVDDEKMTELVESIRDHGVNEPAVAFRNENGDLEMIAGHRRKRACELAGISTIPVIIKDITRDEATILMGESNLQSRDEILPSERAFTYRAMYEAMKRRAGRPSKENVRPVGANLRSDKELADTVGESSRQIQRYIRLTYLIPGLIDLVDKGNMAIRPAVEISYLDSTLQTCVLNYYEDTLDLEDGVELAPGVLPSLAQAQEMRRLAATSKLDEPKIKEILGTPKPNQKEKITIREDQIMKFQKGRTPEQFVNHIIKALDFYEKYAPMIENQKKDRER